MKFILFLSVIFSLLSTIFSQYGSLPLKSIANAEFQLDDKIFTNKSPNLLKKIYSLVNIPAFIIEDKTPPSPPDNIKYTETLSQSIYTLELPSFPVYVKKDDIMITQGTNGVHIEVKDSGLFANDAFFPDLSLDSFSSVVRGKNYQISLKFFEKIKINKTAKIEIIPKEQNSYEIIVTIEKNDLEPRNYLRKIDHYYAKNINSIVSSAKKEEIDKKFKQEFDKSDEIFPNTGEKVEIFRKEKKIEENDSPESDLQSLMMDIKNRLKNQNQNQNQNKNEKTAPGKINYKGSPPNLNKNTQTQAGQLNQNSQNNQENIEGQLNQNGQNNQQNIENKVSDLNKNSQSKTNQLNQNKNSQNNQQNIDLNKNTQTQANQLNQNSKDNQENIETQTQDNQLNQNDQDNQENIEYQEQQSNEGNDSEKEKPKKKKKAKNQEEETEEDKKKAKDRKKSEEDSSKSSKKEQEKAKKEMAESLITVEKLDKKVDKIPVEDEKDDEEEEYQYD